MTYTKFQQIKKVPLKKETKLRQNLEDQFSVALDYRYRVSTDGY